MHEYMDSFKASNGNIYIIDEGWYNHSQQAMCSTFGYNIYGFYIGSRAKEIWKEYNICHREGLLLIIVQSMINLNIMEYFVQTVLCMNKCLQQSMAV